MELSSVSFRELIGRKVLIIGDIGAGKTHLTKRLLIEAIEQRHGGDITVIEMAPHATKVKGLAVGGVLMDSAPPTSRYLG